MDPENPEPPNNALQLVSINIFLLCVRPPYSTGNSAREPLRPCPSPSLMRVLSVKDIPRQLSSFFPIILNTIPKYCTADSQNYIHIKKVEDGDMC